MEIADLKARALKAGEDAQLHWYADDRSDDPVDPPAKLRLILEDGAGATALVGAGEAERSGDGIVLSANWNSPRRALSYTRVWAGAVVSVLQDAGVAATPEVSISPKLDARSVERGLGMIGDLGRISVEDIIEGRKIYVSRAGDGPFVLEVTPEQAGRGADWIAQTGYETNQGADGLRLNLGTDIPAAVDLIVAALTALEGSRATTLVARFAPGATEPWPGA